MTVFWNGVSFARIFVWSKRQTRIRPKKKPKIQKPGVHNPEIRKDQKSKNLGKPQDPKTEKIR